MPASWRPIHLHDLASLFPGSVLDLAAVLSKVKKIHLDIRRKGSFPDNGLGRVICYVTTAQGKLTALFAGSVSIFRSALKKSLFARLFVKNTDVFRTARVICWVSSEALLAECDSSTKNRKISRFSYHDR